MNCGQQINTSNKSEMEQIKMEQEQLQMERAAEAARMACGKCDKCKAEGVKLNPNGVWDLCDPCSKPQKKKAVKKRPGIKVKWCPLNYTHFACECEKLNCKAHHAAGEAHAKKELDERQVMISQGFDYIYIHDLRMWLWVHEDILSGWECQRGCV